MANENKECGFCKLYTEVDKNPTAQKVCVDVDKNPTFLYFNICYSCIIEEYISNVSNVSNVSNNEKLYSKYCHILSMGDDRTKYKNKCDYCKNKDIVYKIGIYKLKKYDYIPSVPEPPPKPNGEDVTPKLIDWITEQVLPMDTITKTVELIKARDYYGFSKYGQHLKTNDGRNTVEDAIQELGDLIQYLYKAKLNGEDIKIIKEIMPVLTKMLE